MNRWKAVAFVLGLMLGSAVTAVSTSSANEAKQIECFSHKARQQYNDPPNEDLAKRYAAGWRLVSNALGAGPSGVFAVYCLEK